MSKSFINSDSFELILRPKKQKLLVVPIGFHLSLRDGDVIRSYTPIPLNCSTKEAIRMPLDILFLIKTYQLGALSKLLSLKTSTEIVSVSQPKGNLELSKIRNHTKFAMLAAGSGITPMISVLEHLLERNCTKM